MHPVAFGCLRGSGWQRVAEVVVYLGLPVWGPIGRHVLRDYKHISLPQDRGPRLQPSRIEFGGIPGPARGGKHLYQRCRKHSGSGMSGPQCNQDRVLSSIAFVLGTNCQQCDFQAPTHTRPRRGLGLLTDPTHIGTKVRALVHWYMNSEGLPPPKPPPHSRELPPCGVWGAATPQSSCKILGLYHMQDASFTKDSVDQ